MFARLKAAWGPLGGIDVIFSCPFISKQIPIELLWADRKNYVARSRLHVDGVGTRSLAHVHDMLLNRWEGHAGDNYSQSHSLFAHCIEVMNTYIARDQAMDAGSPLAGRIGSLTGLPNAEEYQEWRERAGMGLSGQGLSNEVGLDTMLTGDETVRDRVGDGDEEDED